ncbi:glucose-6-phosphate isomerase [Thermodesulfobacteriota bacterium]
MRDFTTDEFKNKMKISFDFNYAMKDFLESEDAVTKEEIEAAKEKCESVIRDIKKERAAGLLPYMDLPYAVAEIDDAKQLASKIRYLCDTFVVLGIGGSALGTTALKTALTPAFFHIEEIEERNAPRLLIADNIDPDWLLSMLKMVENGRTVFNVISKSGSTAETMSQFLIAVKFLKDNVGAKYKDNMIVTTDKSNGVLREIVNREEYASLVVPDGVGGRFSVFSSVGLLPSAVLGIDIDQMLAGARYMDERCKNENLFENPAAMSALINYLYYKKGRNIQVMMPYSSALRDIADWYRQLWAESLGKKYDLNGNVVNVGQTPVKALGVTDQHSQLQLYVEGPDDKLVTFLKVEEFDHELNIPDEYNALDGVSYLCGNSMNNLINAELKATEITLMKNKKPNCTISLPKVNPFTVGQLMYMLEVQTSIMGGLLGINTYDQPGVEQGKEYTYGMIGRKGYESKNDEIEAQRRKEPDFVV